MFAYAFNPVPLFDSWLGFSGSIPQIYWNTWSEEQRYKFLCKRLQMLVEYAETMGIAINANSDAISELANELATLEETFADRFEDYYKSRICEWLQDNLACIVGNAVKFVQFGLDDSGRLVAYIPSNWEFLQFSTSMDYSNDDYGRLAIRY